ncbi:stimulated by retinoic acid gene 6 protein-like isoform X1 [Hemibagrus wyckioides]|uniref:stimulated by retinoic acid gene 6 protein-like isoform X1 n=2 Tax=Hemibagrus wyckioides TaxID=337641 RepID=UPI00266BCA56|nr:stimulated by retinoic acid gene 6 protein-like isoform X1 [Hemibagrus wyckioides]
MGNCTSEDIDLIQDDPPVPVFELFFRNETDLQHYCKIFENFFVPCSMLPSVLIILLLSFAERRGELCEYDRRFPCLKGRFSFIIPVDFTGKIRNRWSYGFAFGAVTPFMIKLIFRDSNLLNFPTYLKVLEVVIVALMVSIACLPLFTCLSTSNRLLGGVLGLFYSLCWFIALLWKLIFCREILAGEGHQNNLWHLHNIPQLLCLVFLVCRFVFCIKKGVKSRMSYSKQEEVMKHEYKYVMHLLRRHTEVSVEKSWFQRKVYEWDPYFKFPNRIIATVVLCVLGVYMITTTEQTIAQTSISDTKEYLTGFLNESTIEKHLNYITYTWYISTACAILLSLIHISQVLVYYRMHIKSLRAGEKKYLPKTYELNAVQGVVGFLKYPGYQIAFSIWGYVIVHVGMFIIGLMCVYLVISPIRENGLCLWLKWLGMSFGNFITLFGLIMLQSKLGQILFLQDKTSPTDKRKPLALKNRKAFHNFNYFFFFFNMILGLMNCLLRVIKSLAVGVMLVSRIERSIMPEGFETLDHSYCTWVGMIMADHYHTNPVLVCFCHLLLKHPSEGIQDDGYSRLDRELLEKNRVHIRWHLVYTLLRNPKLILLRKKRKQKSDKDGHLAFAWAVTNTA